MSEAQSLFGDQHKHRCREIGGERARLWQNTAAMWPDHEGQATRTTREIPVVVLERR